jgi:hypothetical protein
MTQKNFFAFLLHTYYKNIDSLQGTGELVKVSKYYDVRI